MPSDFKSDDQIDFWSQSIQDEYLLSKSFASTSGSGAHGLSDLTLSNLSSKLSNLTACMEIQHSEKSKSKNKFENLDDHAQKMMLNSSAECNEFSDTSPVSTLKQLLNCSTASKSQICLNQMLQLKRCKVSVGLAFASFLMSGDWIVRNSENPDKFSVFFLGPNNDGRQFKSTSKDQLRTHLQQLFGSALSKESLENMMFCNFCEVKDYFPFSAWYSLHIMS